MDYLDAFSGDRPFGDNPEGCHYAVVVPQIELARLVHLIKLADYILDRLNVYFAELARGFCLTRFGLLVFLSICGFLGLFGYSGLFRFPGSLFFFLSLFLSL